jgi:transcriptional regulator GlxA family with amidase domain
MAHRIAFVVYPDFQLLDIAGPMAAFEVAERMRPGSYAWSVVAPRAGAVRASAGVAWPARALPRAGSFDTAMVSGGDGVNRALGDLATLRWVARAASASARVTSVCSGSLLLAASGVLDGREATTHWSRTQEFRRLFPRVRLQPDRIFARDGAFWTSAGITAGIDLALALITADLGDALARRVAQQLVVYYRRPGGQSQFSQLLALGRPDGRFAPLLDHVRSHLGEPHGVAALAERACMSPRHFARAFKAETGATPAQAVQRLRLEAARAALEGPAASLERVARTCGFGSAEQMRRGFVRLFGSPPSALKRRSQPPCD